MRRISLNYIRRGSANYFCSENCTGFKKLSTLTNEEKRIKKDVKNGPNLNDFLVVGKNLPKIHYDDNIPYLKPHQYSGMGRKVFFEIYGCQMNSSDAEVIWSILNKNEYKKCEDILDADVILVVTCAIREGAETKIWNRLKHLHALKVNASKRKRILQIGVLGCMAERLKVKLIEKEKWVDILAGPDSYKDLPRLLSVSQSGQSAVNVLLSLDETYADIMPVRLNENAVTAYVSIMRGCDNMCSYCIVPFTRGKERSRPLNSVKGEILNLADNGIREITLLGQNVNSYRDLSRDNIPNTTELAAGFKTVYKPKIGGIRFSELLECVAKAAPEVRFRFTSPHPKDFPDDLIKVIKNYPNICKSLHLPAQSGSNTVLERMRRGYTREAYITLVEHIRSLVPGVSLSSDFICGFCGETESEFEDTLTLIKQIKYNVAYLFAYSMREKTTAHRRYIDDVSDEVKKIRLKKMIECFRQSAESAQSKFVGEQELILIEGTSKRSKLHLYGRNDANIKVIIPIQDIPIDKCSTVNKSTAPGDFVVVQIEESNSQILKGIPLYHSSISNFSKEKNVLLDL